MYLYVPINDVTANVSGHYRAMGFNGQPVGIERMDVVSNASKSLYRIRDDSGIDFDTHFQRSTQSREMGDITLPVFFEDFMTRCSVELKKDGGRNTVDAKIRSNDEWGECDFEITADDIQSTGERWFNKTDLSRRTVDVEFKRPEPVQVKDVKAEMRDSVYDYDSLSEEAALYFTDEEISDMALQAQEEKE